MNLSQIDTQTAQEIGKAIGKGVEMTAQSSPTHWLQMVVSLIGAIALCWVVHRFIQSGEKTRTHIDGLVTRMMEHQTESAADCHVHSREMVRAFEKPLDDLRTITGDLKVTVHDLRGDAQARRRAADKELPKP